MPVAEDIDDAAMVELLLLALGRRRGIFSLSPGAGQDRAVRTPVPP